MRLLAFLLYSLSAVLPDAEEGILLKKIGEQILRFQTKDGAILMKPCEENENYLIPYFSNFASIGLSIAYKATKEEKYLKSAKAWLEWYVKHLNPDGTIYDYKGSPSELNPTMDYDSSDAYAGTFITAIWFAYSVKPDKLFLKKIYPAVKKAIEGIKLTLQDDNLTFAKLTHPVKYLMDNVETWQGLHYAGKIAELLGFRDDARYFSQLASSMLDSLEKQFWDAENHCYAWAIYTNGAKASGLKRWYPEQMANLMAIAWLPPSSRRKELYVFLRKELVTKIKQGADELIWWAMASQGAGAKEDTELFLFKLLKGDFLSLPPYQLGHLARIIYCEGKGEREGFNQNSLKE
ncbi:hypothetical protein H5T87_04470 [bacterium]|nr:hypothetical protein [bacterium]